MNTPSFRGITSIKLIHEMELRETAFQKILGKWQSIKAKPMMVNMVDGSSSASDADELIDNRRVGLSQRVDGLYPMLSM